MENDKRLNELFIISGLIDEKSEEMYQIVSENSKNTCELCKKMDGKVFLKKDAILGDNYPPFHLSHGHIIRICLKCSNFHI